MPTATRANVAALIPGYFEEKHIREVATRAKAQLDLVLVVDDGSTDRTSDEAKAAGAEVLAAGSIIDRSGGTADLGVPRVALATLTVTTYKPESCPLCEQGMPVQKPGSRPGK